VADAKSTFQLAQGKDELFFNADKLEINVTARIGRFA
jgi:hypothetical protein